MDPVAYSLVYNLLSFAILFFLLFALAKGFFEIIDLSKENRDLSFLESVWMMKTKTLIFAALAMFFLFVLLSPLALEAIEDRTLSVKEQKAWQKHSDTITESFKELEYESNEQKVN